MVSSENSVSAEQIKKLREETGAGIMECKKALLAAAGQMEEAAKILRAKGADLAKEKSAREATQGLIGSYVHGGRIGVLVEVNCETDFVARTPEFSSFVHDLCLQVASMKPLYIRREDVPHEEIAATLARLHEEIGEAEEEGAVAMQKSYMENFYRERVLLDQPSIKDASKTIQDLLHDLVVHLRENIVIRRLTRFSLGEQTGSNDLNA